jgi:predicted GTPase
MKKVIILGAAGRDFHNFNTYFRSNPQKKVICFTATQIPNIGGRQYPSELAGELYPNGIPIYEESKLINIIKENDIDEVYFSYSDVSNEYVMEMANKVLAAGCDFHLLGTKSTMLQSKNPVISICAVRTGCGKSQTSRKITKILKELGKKPVVIRHPMPYGNLVEQNVQRFDSIESMEKNKCTIEEMEEYEPHINQGAVVYAGVDYEMILRKAEQESDIIVWDGGNNDFPFLHPDLEIVITDPHRPGDELRYYPGTVNLIRADIVIINKIDSADYGNINTVRNNIRQVNPDCIIIDAASPIFVENFEIIKGKRVLVVEDGPTLTHGNMKYGSGVIGARKYGAKEIVDPKPFTVGEIAKTFEKYPHLGPILPALGYSHTQIKDLEKTINKIDADIVVFATPVDLRRILTINKQSVRVSYELQEIGDPTLKEILTEWLKKNSLS